MDWTKANEKCGVGTFILMVLMLGLMVWTQYASQTANQQGAGPMTSVAHWWPVLVAALAIVVAAFLHFFASKVDKKSPDAERQIKELTAAYDEKNRAAADRDARVSVLKEENARLRRQLGPDHNML